MHEEGAGNDAPQDKRKTSPYKFPVSSESLEQALRTLSTTGKLLKDRGQRQVWRFEHEGKAYYLDFFPRRDSKIARMLRGNLAMKQFLRLQLLQKGQIPSPRVRSVLMGFRIGEQLGDAVISDGIEPSIRLDQHLNQLRLEGRSLGDHRDLAEQVIAIVRKLGEAQLGHDDLRLHNFALKDGKLYLLDGLRVRSGGLKSRDVMRLGHSAARFITRGDLLHGWETLTHGSPLPKTNPVARERYRAFERRCEQENDQFGQLDLGNWSGFFFKRTDFPRRWSVASRMNFTREDWEKAWPDILRRIEADDLTVLKRERSGEIFSGTVDVAGQSLEIVIKRPLKKFWYRYITSAARISRTRRTWLKAWSLFIRNLPMEWPLAVMETRKFGYVTDGIIVFEKMRGDLLATMDLDSLSPAARHTMFHRLGRALRLLEKSGMSHTDAKAYNWIIDTTDPTGPLPIMIDVDGVQHGASQGEGIDRLLRGMREHPQYTVEDSLHLCRGYAPWGRLLREKKA